MKIISKSLKEAKNNLRVAEEYYNRNMVFMNYQALERAKAEVKHWKS